MKRFHLIKRADHAQIAHLYEHIFCDTLYKYLKSRQLYAFLDYDLNARTYYSGLIELRLTLLSDRAREEEAAIRSLEPIFTEDVINRGLSEVLAEKESDIASLDTAVVLEKLHRYQNEPWRDYDELDVENAADHLRTRKGLTLRPRSKRQFLTLRQDVVLDSSFAKTDPPTIWPLFYVVGCFFILNLQDAIASGTSCYSYDSFGDYSTKIVKETNLYRVDRRQANTLTTEAQITADFIKTMLADGVVERLAADLQAAESTVPGAAPNPNGLYASTAYLIGAAGWRRIGTETNIRQVLGQTHISFSLGKSKESVDIARYM